MFKLSNRSLARLEGVNPDLVKVVKTAITITSIDFGVSEGLRTQDRQQYLYEQGKTQTLNSKHLDGLAVDLFAFVNDRVSWHHSHYFFIANAMKESAKLHNIAIRWGGAWNVPDLKESLISPEECNEIYNRMRRKQGRTPFNDLPHFELM